MKFRNCLVCDHVYFDKRTNKAILAGVYTGDMVATAPELIGLAFYGECIPEQDGEVTMRLQIMKSKRTLGYSDIRLVGLTKGKAAPFVIPEFTIELTGDFELAIVAHTPADATTGKVIIKKKCVLRPPTTDPSPIEL